MQVTITGDLSRSPRTTAYSPDLTPDTQSTGEQYFDERMTDHRDWSRLMDALDQVNARVGKRTLLLRCSYIEQGADVCSVKQVRRTPK